MRDTVAEFENVAVIGISGDASERQKRFDDKNDLGYSLLSDVDHQVAEAFGVWREKWLYGKSYLGVVRSAFVISADGLVEHAFYKISVSESGPKLREVLTA